MTVNATRPAVGDPTLREEYRQLLAPLCAGGKETERKLVQAALSLGLEALEGKLREAKI